MKKKHVKKDENRIRKKNSEIKSKKTNHEFFFSNYLHSLTPLISELHKENRKKENLASCNKGCVILKKYLRL